MKKHPIIVEILLRRNHKTGIEWTQQDIKDLNKMKVADLKKLNKEEKYA